MSEQPRTLVSDPVTPMGEGKVARRSAEESATGVAGHPQARSDRPFFFLLIFVGGSYVLLIVALLLADASFTTPWHLLGALRSREILYAVRLSLISCTITAILSVWVAIPLGYLLARFRFPGKEVVDALLDIPIVLPPLVIGLSLLILFQTAPGRAVRAVTYEHMGGLLTYGLLPGAAGLFTWSLYRSLRPDGRGERAGIAAAILTGLVVSLTPLGSAVAGWTQAHFRTDITYEVPAVILAQFAVACAFAVRTMRITFEQITLRREQVALTLGCSRAQAFARVVLPEARRGIVTAGTLAWARALGEFGPILVFAGATRLRTEVLSSTVFLELSVGNLDGAVAVSLLMVGVALGVLLIVRFFGMGRLVA
jgi:molybdate transport system permease protein